MTRNGKIARLPRELREELNLRLERSIPGITLVSWLNSLPEVQEVLDLLFEGKPVSPQNLSEWRQGGYAEWQDRRDFIHEVRETSDDADDLEGAAANLAERATRELTARYLLLVRTWNGDPDDPACARLDQLATRLRQLSHVRRGDLAAARLRMEEHAFDLACHDREIREVQRNRVPFPPFQKWVRRVGLHRSPLPPDSFRVQPPAAPPVPEAATPEFHSIKPNHTENDTPPGTENGPATVPPPAPAPTPPETPLPSAIITKNEVTKAPAPSPTAKPAKSVPVSDAELWQMRNRPLPSDPIPEWRKQLPLNSKLPPPWACPSMPAHGPQPTPGDSRRQTSSPPHPPALLPW